MSKVIPKTSAYPFKAPIIAPLAGLLVLIGCLWAGCSNTPGTAPVTTQCLQTMDFDSVPICLPALDSLVPCADHPLIKAALDEGQVPGVVRLGYYLSPRDLRNISPEMLFQDPTLFIAGKRPKSPGLLGPLDLAYLDGLVSKDAIDKRWESVKEKYDGTRGSKDWGAMVLLDKYEPRANALTSVVSVDLGETALHPIQLSFISHLIVRNRLCQVFYYVPYRSVGSLETGRVANDAILKTFMEANPPLIDGQL